MIDNVSCCSLHHKSGLPITELAVTQFKLISFWIRHQDRTGCEVGVTAKTLMWTTFEALNLLKEQKRFEDGWAANNKEPEYTTIALDLTSADNAFEQVKTNLTCFCGVLGVPLVYSIQHLLIPVKEEAEPPFWGGGLQFSLLVTTRQLSAVPSWPIKRITAT